MTFSAIITISLIGWRIVSGLKLDKLETFASAERDVYHMEADQYKAGNILFSDYNALKTTDGFNTSIVAGSALKSGYADGIGAEARFSTILGFTQIDARTVVVSDRWNHCLRLVDRPTGNVTTFVGDCGNKGYVDGMKARFDQPWSVVKYNGDLIVADNKNKALRLVDIQNGKVSTLSKSSGFYAPSGMYLDKDGDLLYIAERILISEFSISNLIYKKLSGDSDRGDKVGSVSQAAFDGAYDVLPLSAAVILVADHWNNVVKVVDMLQNKVSSICKGDHDTRDGSSSECGLEYPSSLLLHNGHVYIGTSKSIRKLSGDFTNLTVIDKNNTGPICPSGDLNIAIPKGSRTVDVEISPGVYKTFSPGQYTVVVPTTNCVRRINVAAARSSCHDKKCKWPGAVCRDVGNTAVCDCPPGQVGDGDIYCEAPGMLCPNDQLICSKNAHCHLEEALEFSCECNDGFIGSGVYCIDGDECASIEKNNCDFHADCVNLFGGYTCSCRPGYSGDGFHCKKEANLQWRFAIQADYKTRCSSLLNSTGLTLVEKVASYRYNYIEQVCNGVVTRSNMSKISTSCNNDVLTVNWPVTPQQDSTSPEVTKSQIESCVSKFDDSELEITVANQIPPVLKPMTTGASKSCAVAVLEYYCTNGLHFDKNSLSCKSS